MPEIERPRGGDTGSSEGAAGAILGDPHARSVYAASAGSRPLALLASAGIMAAMAAALATLGIAAQHKRQANLTTMDVHELDVRLPPAAGTPRADVRQAAPSQTVAPKPMLLLPSEGLKQVMLDVPPPPAPPMVTSEGVKPAAAPAAAPAPSSSSSGDLSSTLLFAKPPVYPMDARRSRAEGLVKLWVVVGSDGRVQDIRVARSSGTDSLDRAALQAVKHWRWKPSPSGDAGLVSIPFTIKA